MGVLKIRNSTNTAWVEVGAVADGDADAIHYNQVDEYTQVDEVTQMETGSLFLIEDENGAKKYVKAGYGGGMVVVMTQTTTFYIDNNTGSDTTGDGSSGNPWATLQHGVEFCYHWIIIKGVYLDFIIADGVQQNQSHSFTHPYSTGIRVKGTTTLSRTINSVQSTSGSAGAWSVIVNMSSVADIAVNDYLTVRNCTGGTHPKTLNGCHKITNVDVTNTRLTLAVNQRDTLICSGAVTTTVAYVNKTVLDFGDNAMNVYPGIYLYMNNITIISSTAGTLSYAIRCIGTGARCTLGSYMSNYCSAQEISYVLTSERGALITASYFVGSGGYSTFFAQKGGLIIASYGVGTDNQVACYAYMGGSFIDFTRGEAIGNAYGVYSVQKAYIYAYLVEAHYNTATAVYSSQYAFNRVDSMNVSNNLVDYSPALNTQGNEYAYNDS